MADGLLVTGHPGYGPHGDEPYGRMPCVETAYAQGTAYAWEAAYAWERAVPGLNGWRGMGDVCKAEVIFLAGLGRYIDGLISYLDMLIRMNSRQNKREVSKKPLFSSTTVCCALNCS